MLNLKPCTGTMGILILRPVCNLPFSFWTRLAANSVNANLSLARFHTSAEMSLNSTTTSRKDVFSLYQQDCPVCPPCFNCHLPQDQCANGGSCEDSGLCSCPAGWGSQDCSEPLCGSLGAPERQPRQGDSCNCDPGYSLDR
ncbi:hypothetical protein BC943DRAFT_52968 [Umbelopsis sp. AD052]|nr:hypothetical protein BC943DRAFT_52968 [Umbelopsis sp. AD052]